MTATSFYAVVLQKFRNRLEPDWTWAEVVIGVGIVLLAARWIRQDWPEAGPEEVEAIIWMAFFVGGLPIIAWQVWLRNADLHGALEETKAYASKAEG